MHQFIEVSQWIITFTILFELFLVFKRISNRVYCHLYIFCVSMLVSSYGYLLHLYATSANALFLTFLFTCSGRVFAVVCSWRFVHSVCDYNIPEPYKSLDFFIGIITLFVVTTTEKTGLFFSNIEMETEGDWYILRYDRSIAYLIWDLIVLFAITVMLARLFITLKKTRDLNKRKMFRLLLLGTAGNVLTAPFAMLPVGKYYDFNQVGFFIASIVIVIAMLKYNLGEIEQSTKEYMFNELSSGVIAIEKDRRSVYYNKVAQDIFPELDTNSYDVLENIDSAFKSGETISFQDKTYTPEEKTLDNGNRLFILNDSTKHYQHIKEIEEQKQISEKANKAKSDFLTSMSHEIRTPINTVLGMDEMILRTSRDEEIREYATDIRSAGHTLLSIIDDILDLSKIESGKMELIPGPYDTANLINDAINMVRFHAKEKKLGFDVYVSPDTPSKLIGDDVRLRQILTNLLSNAVKYTETGSVVFRVDVKGEDSRIADGFVTLHFEVEDSGIGIKPKDMNRLFDDFERLDQLKNRNIEGTGLGLSITTKLLKMMDSGLRVSSEYGKGSVFSFDLRQEIDDATPVGDFTGSVRETSASSAGFENSFSAPDARILVVDDNDLNRKVFASLLRSTQMTIVEAEDGQEAVNLASNERFDIIFMDHMMPGLDGVEAMKQIKAQTKGPCADTPVIVLTANAIAGAKEKYLEDGFDGFLSKPVIYEKLEKAIKEFLPPDKVKEAFTDSSPSGHDEKTAADTDDFPPIFGVDWKTALMRLQNKEILDSVLSDFELSIDKQAEKLQGFKDRLPETFADYRILVHALKSASASIGSFTLSGMAAILEKAASEEDADSIDRLHDIFIRELKGYKTELREYLHKDDTTEADKEEITDEILHVLFDMLSSAMDDMDIDGADDAMNKLASYKLPERISKEFDALQLAVLQLDRDAVLELIEKLK